jgi:hypothetical protein
MECQETAKAVFWLGETIGFWIQTGAFFLSAVGAIAVIYYNGKQARVTSLINLLLQQKSDVSLIEATRRVHSLKANGTALSHHVNNDSEERKDILKVLNNQEFIAVGIRLKVFDENVYKQSQCTNLLRLWDVSRGFIHELRSADGKDTIFQDFEQLAVRWEEDPIKKIHPKKPFWAKFF